MLNCPNTRHIVGFLVNQIFLCNSMNSFDYIEDNRRMGFLQVTTWHQSHRLEFVRKRDCHKWLQLEQAEVDSRGLSQAAIWTLCFEATEASQRPTEES